MFLTVIEALTNLQIMMMIYASKKLIPRERNYSVGERKALAIIWAVKKFHRYLYGQHFTLESDHRPLEQNSRFMSRSSALQPYRYTVCYIRGTENVIAD